MKNYIQPTAKVVELSVKESLSLTNKTTKSRTFGFGSYKTGDATITQYLTKAASSVSVVNG
ncbi:MAG: hypothetical protein IJ365_08985 [Clostridia bacterium]|nr:hypothetical protein [Clostridia bacterium]